MTGNADDQIPHSLPHLFNLRILSTMSTLFCYLALWHPNGDKRIKIHLLKIYPKMKGRWTWIPLCISSPFSTIPECTNFHIERRRHNHNVSLKIRNTTHKRIDIFKLRVDLINISWSSTIKNSRRSIAFSLIVRVTVHCKPLLHEY